MAAVFVANSNMLELQGLFSEVEQAFVNDAAVSATVKDSNGVPLSGQTWPLTLTYVAASNGDYRAILLESLPFQNKKTYTASIDADGGTGKKGHWEFSFNAQTRVG